MTDPGTAGSGRLDPQQALLRIEATTAEEFAGLLREILRRSRLSASQVAVKSGLPRSTVYRWANPENSVLPRSPEQVRAFCRACRLDDADTEQVMRLWAQLAEDLFESRSRATPARSSTASGDSSTPQASVVSNDSIVINRGSQSVNIMDRSSSSGVLGIGLKLTHRMTIMVLVFAVFTAVAAVVASVTALHTAESVKSQAQADLDNLVNLTRVLPPGGSWYRLNDFQPLAQSPDIVRSDSRINGVVQSNTLSSTAAASSVTYALNESCSALVATAGIFGPWDMTAAEGLSAQFTISVDNSPAATFTRHAVDPFVSQTVFLLKAKTLELSTSNPQQTMAAWTGLNVYCTSPPGQKLP